MAVKLKKLKLKGKAIISNSIDEFKLLFLDEIKARPNYEEKRIADTPLLKALYLMLKSSIYESKLEDKIDASEIFKWGLNTVYELTADELNLLEVLINQFESDYIEKKSKNKFRSFFLFFINLLKALL